MRIIEIRIQVADERVITEIELVNFAETIKDYIYDLEDSAIQDVTYEIRDDYQDDSLTANSAFNKEN
jgi:hypothetical protein